MIGYLGVEGAVYVLIFWIGLAVKLFAFVVSLTYPSEAYAAAGKWSKPGWTTVLGAAVLLTFVPVPLPLVGVALLIAALVFLADVRPALSGLRRR